MTNGFLDGIGTVLIMFAIVLLAIGFGLGFLVGIEYNNEEPITEPGELYIDLMERQQSIRDDLRILDSLCVEFGNCEQRRFTDE